MSGIIRVGMAEYQVAKAPEKISTLGLGSCIGICAYDPIMKIGGMVHIMLPNSSLAIDQNNPAKFANTGLPLLIREMEKNGAHIKNIIVKIAGGAEMFVMSGQEEHIGVGERNIRAVEEICQTMNIPIVAKSVGGHAGKTITLDLENGELEIKTMSEHFKI